MTKSLCQTGAFQLRLDFLGPLALIFLGPVALVTAGGELESEAAGAGYYRHHKLARPLQESRQELLTGFK